MSDRALVDLLLKDWSETIIEDHDFMAYLEEVEGGKVELRFSGDIEERPDEIIYLVEIQDRWIEADPDAEVGGENVAKPDLVSTLQELDNLEDVNSLLLVLQDRKDELTHRSKRKEMLSHFGTTARDLSERLQVFTRVWRLWGELHDWIEVSYRGTIEDIDHFAEMDMQIRNELSQSNVPGWLITQMYVALNKMMGVVNKDKETQRYE